MRIAILICCVSAALSCNGCRNAKHGPGLSDPVIVQTIPIQSAWMSLPVHTAGIISTQDEMKLGFKIGGVIASIAVEEGQPVNKGQVLARLNLSEIDGQVTQAKLALEKAKRDYQRALNLYNDSVATLEQLQNANTMLEATEASVRTAAFNRQYSLITAPAAGTILKKLANENEIIGAGYPVFLFGSTSSGWVFRGNVTDREIGNLSEGNAAEVHLDAFPGKALPAKLTRMASFADPYTGTYEIELSMLSHPVKLNTGLLGTAEIIPDKKEKFCLVPTEAMTEGNEQYAYIYLVRNEHPVKTRIMMDRMTDSLILTRDSLPADAFLVVTGASYITSGRKLRIMPRQRN